MKQKERFVYVVEAYQNLHSVGFSRPAGTDPMPVPLAKAKVYIQKSGAQARADRLNGSTAGITWVVTPIKLNLNDPEERFCLVADNSGHRYTIPVRLIDEWCRVALLPENDPLSWDVPVWATRVEGALTFTDPQT